MALLGSAQRRWLYMAPGVTIPIAEAVDSAWKRMGPASGSVILDVDPEVYRLGYGTVEVASHHGTLICRHQEGVRIGLLISDDHTLIFSPTPLLIETGSSRVDHPNAIELVSVPEAVARDVGLGPQGAEEQLVGLDSATAAEIEQTQEDLTKNPPVKFDIARKVRWNSSSSIWMDAMYPNTPPVFHRSFSDWPRTKIFRSVSAALSR